MQILFPAFVHCDRFGCRNGLHHSFNSKSRLAEGVYDLGKCSVVLSDAFDEPFCTALPAAPVVGQLVVKHVAVVVPEPSRAGDGRGRQRMLLRKDEVPAGIQYVINASAQRGKILDVMQSKRAENNVVLFLDEGKIAHIRASEFDVGMLLCCDGKHFLGDINAENCGCASRLEFSAVFTVSASKIEDSLL